MTNYLLKDVDDSFWNKVKKKTQQQDIHLKHLVLELLRLWLKGEIKVDYKKLRRIHQEVKSKGYAQRTRQKSQKQEEDES